MISILAIALTIVSVVSEASKPNILVIVADDLVS